MPLIYLHYKACKFDKLVCRFGIKIPGRLYPWTIKWIKSRPVSYLNEFRAHAYLEGYFPDTDSKTLKLGFYVVHGRRRCS